jgi:ribonucleoside-diphosphate reductase alpha chain
MTDNATARKRLPNRRLCENFTFEHAGMKYIASVARYGDGRLGEIFISNHKSGSDADAAAKDSAVVCSIALQYGVPIETIRKALLRDSQGCPSSPLGQALDLIVEDSGA